MSLAFDRLYTGSYLKFDRLVDVTGVPRISSLSNIQDGAAITLTGTTFSASLNTVFAVQGTKTLQLAVATESTTSIVTVVLDASGIYVSQPLSIYMVDASGNVSNAITAPIIPATGQAVLSVTQEFLGDPSKRISANPDLAFGDELRLRNFTGLNVTGQGVPDAPSGTPTFEAAAQDGTSLGSWGTVQLTGIVNNATVPSVVNQTFVAAQAAIIAAGLIPVVVGDTPSVSVAAGSIAGQFPDATTVVALNSVVELTISDGIVLGLVPNLIGQNLPGALDQLAIAGITLIAISYIAGGADLSITNQSLTPGTTVVAGSTISIEMSLGSAGNVTVPDLSTDTEAQARYAVLIGYLLANVAYVKSTTVRRGFVISQSPTASSAVAPGSTVTILISLGALLNSGGGFDFSFGFGFLQNLDSSADNVLLENGDRVLAENGTTVIVE